MVVVTISRRDKTIHEYTRTRNVSIGPFRVIPGLFSLSCLEKIYL